MLDIVSGKDFLTSVLLRLVKIDQIPNKYSDFENASNTEYQIYSVPEK